MKKILLFICMFVFVSAMSQTATKVMDMVNKGQSTTGYYSGSDSYLYMVDVSAYDKRVSWYDLLYPTRLSIDSVYDYVSLVRDTINETITSSLSGEGIWTNDTSGGDQGTDGYEFQSVVYPTATSPTYGTTFSKLYLGYAPSGYAPYDFYVNGKSYFEDVVKMEGSVYLAGTSRLTGVMRIGSTGTNSLYAENDSIWVKANDSIYSIYDMINVDKTTIGGDITYNMGEYTFSVENDGTYVPLTIETNSVELSSSQLTLTGTNIDINASASLDMSIGTYTYDFTGTDVILGDAGDATDTVAMLSDVRDLLESSGTGTGDMTKAVYDTDENSVVDSSEFSAAASYLQDGDSTLLFEVERSANAGFYRRYSSATSRYDTLWFNGCLGSGWNMFCKKNLFVNNNIYGASASTPVISFNSSHINVAGADIYSTGQIDIPSGTYYTIATADTIPDRDWVRDYVTNNAGAGTGDMTKAVYDTDENSVVDSSEFSAASSYLQDGDSTLLFEIERSANAGFYRRYSSATARYDTLWFNGCLGSGWNMFCKKNLFVTQSIYGSSTSYPSIAIHSSYIDVGGADIYSTGQINIPSGTYYTIATTDTVTDRDWVRNNTMYPYKPSWTPSSGVYGIMYDADSAKMTYAEAIQMPCCVLSFKDASYTPSITTVGVPVQLGGSVFNTVRNTGTSTCTVTGDSIQWPVDSWANISVNINGKFTDGESYTFRIYVNNAEISNQGQCTIENTSASTSYYSKLSLMLNATVDLTADDWIKIVVSNSTNTNSPTIYSAYIKIKADE